MTNKQIYFKWTQYIIYYTVYDLFTGQIVKQPELILLK